MVYGRIAPTYFTEISLNFFSSIKQRKLMSILESHKWKLFMFKQRTNTERSQNHKNRQNSRTYDKLLKLF